MQQPANKSKSGENDNAESGSGGKRRQNARKRGAYKATPEVLEAVREAVLHGARLEDACKSHRISADTYQRHHTAKSPEWRRAEELFLAAYDEEAKEEARRRILEVLKCGTDAAAVKAAMSLLGMSDKHEVKSDATHRLVQERQDLLETMMQDPEFGPLMSRMTERVERERER